ncbi:MAG: DnaA/Hda family protein [Alphaproteobacteria bacterium]|nr:DnaA/Hda family protein [Alphaproteobacteria bacterium]
MTSGQLPLDLGHRTALGKADFVVAAGNRDAVAWLDRWPGWPASALVIYGPAGCGKSHLVAVWRALSGARALSADQLIGASLAPLIEAPGHLALDDAETVLAVGSDAAETALFHLYNASRERGDTMLLTAHTPPARWPLGLADLASRLAALPTIAVAQPDDGLMAAVLAKLFSDRQLAVDDRVIDYLATHMERSFSTARQLVDVLDREALARRRPVTRPLAAELLAQLEAQSRTP